MFFDIGPLEVVTLLVLAVILAGPEKLPTMVSNVAKNIRRLRAFMQSAQADIRAELPTELQDMALEDLNPKSLVRKHLLSAEDLDLDFSEPAAGSGPEREPLGGPAANTSKTPQMSAGSGPVPAATDHHHDQQSTQRTPTNH
ncbi:Sec-independent protein translocase subunit TatB [Streptomyces sp. NPDC002758]